MKPPIDAEFSIVTSEPRAKPGPKPMYSEELASEVCRRMTEGESLRQICRDPAMPKLTTVMKWARESPAFAQLYAHAREALLEHWAEEINEIADDSSNDWIERETKSGRLIMAPDHDHINRARLRVDTRKWLLSKLAPRKYGDKLEVTGNMAHTVQPTSTEPLTVEQAEVAYLQLVNESPTDPKVVN